MSKKQTVKKVSSIILAVVLLLLLVGAVGIVAKLTNNFTDKLKTFYLEYDGKVLSSTADLSVNPSEVKVDVKYVFNGKGEDEELTDYSVSILPYATNKTAFDYTVDGKNYRYEKDANIELNSAFNLEKHDTYFTFTMPRAMKDVLSQVYGDSEIAIPESVDISVNPYFYIVVKSYNQKTELVVRLLLKTVKVEDIEVDRESYVF